MENTLAAAYNIPLSDGIPVVVGILAIGLGIALGRWLIISRTKRQHANNLQQARAKGIIGKNGLVVKTYTKWGILKNGYMLADADKIVLQDKHRNVMNEFRRTEIASVSYEPSISHNCAFVFKLRDGSSVTVFTFKPAAANPYTDEIKALMVSAGY
jgi:hypothetical protein